MTTVNFPPRVTAHELGLTAGPEAVVDWQAPNQVAIYKTVQIFLNKVIYADGYLAV